MYLTEEILNAAESLQKEKQDFIATMKAKYPQSDVSYEDWQTSFLLIKIAELQEEVKALTPDTESMVNQANAIINTERTHLPPTI